MEEEFAQDRTMDRYEQIHFFFQVMIEHNVKTLVSCAELHRPSPDPTKADDGEQATNSK